MKGGLTKVGFPTTSSPTEDDFLIEGGLVVSELAPIGSEEVAVVSLVDWFMRCQ
jgi:hypothetical protein